MWFCNIILMCHYTNKPQVHGYCASLVGCCLCLRLLMYWLTTQMEHTQTQGHTHTHTHTRSSSDTHRTLPTQNLTHTHKMLREHTQTVWSEHRNKQNTRTHMPPSYEVSRPELCCTVEIRSNGTLDVARWSCCLQCVCVLCVTHYSNNL